MFKRAALLSSIPLATLALVTGCSGGDATTTSARRPVSAASSAPTSDPGDGTAPTSDPGDGATTIGDPGDGGMPAGLGEDADWRKMVSACPHKGQKPVIQKVVTADVTGDGVHDALVARSCEAVTSYWPSTVEVFDGASQPAKPRRIGVLLDEVGAADQPWVTKLRAGGREVTIEAHGVDELSDNACPDLNLTYRYRFSGGDFQRVARQVGNADACLPVG